MPRKINGGINALNLAVWRLAVLRQYEGPAVRFASPADFPPPLARVWGLCDGAVAPWPSRGVIGVARELQTLHGVPPPVPPPARVLRRQASRVIDARPRKLVEITYEKFPALLQELAGLDVKDDDALSDFTSRWGRLGVGLPGAPGVPVDRIDRMAEVLGALQRLRTAARPWKRRPEFWSQFMALHGGPEVDPNSARVGSGFAILRLRRSESDPRPIVELITLVDAILIAIGSWPFPGPVSPACVECGVLLLDPERRPKFHDDDCKNRYFARESMRKKRALDKLRVERAARRARNGRRRRSTTGGRRRGSG